MALRIAFAGFRHGHIFSLVDKVRAHAGCALVAACEEHAPTREAISSKIECAYDDTRRMLDTVDCEVLAIGDYFTRRGALAIEALERGKHVIADKPLCTDLGELDIIERLAREKDLRVGCMLSLRWSPRFRRLKQLVDDGALGTVHQIAIGGQHVLNYAQRPAWYFEPGRHGGTVTDIGIHGVDFIRYATGLELKRVCAARQWNAFADQAPGFMDSAQFQLELTNGAGVLGDMSYAMPAGLGGVLPQYWRTTIYGSKGLAETGANIDHVLFAPAGADQPERLPGLEVEGDYLSDFMADIAGQKPGALATADVLASHRATITIQQAADRG